LIWKKIKKYSLYGYEAFKHKQFDSIDSWNALPEDVEPIINIIEKSPNQD
jgi:hypothetical protein